MQYTGKRKRGPESDGNKRPRQYTRLTRPIPLVARSAREKGAIDVGVSTAPVTGTSALVLLNGSVPGTGIGDRIARRIIMKSIQLRLSFNYKYTAAASAPWTDYVHNSFRFLVVYDSQTNGAAPLVSAILKSDDPASLLNLDNRDRFKVIIDKYVNTGGAITPSWIASSTAVTFENMQKKYRKLNLVTTYNAGTAGTVADIQTGALWLLCMYNGAEGGDVSLISAINGYSRVRFLSD